MKTPNLFIVGCPKAGTTALYYFLKDHPQICMSPVKEPQYFSTDFHRSQKIFNEKYWRFNFNTKEQYLQLYADWNNEPVAGEASTTYIYSKEAAENIKQFNPDAKIIIILREPVSFLYALHEELTNALREDKDFRTALSLEDNRKLRINLPKIKHYPESLYYSERIKYIEQIKRYTERFQNKNIKIIIHEEFKENNEKIFKEILEFLNVDSSFKPRFAPYNAAKKLKSPFLMKLVQNNTIWSAGKAIIPLFLRKKVKKIVRKSLYTYQKRKQMDPELKKELMKKMKPQVEELSAFLDKDLVSLWNYNEIN